jgi:hypothetical protein
VDDHDGASIAVQEGMAMGEVAHNFARFLSHRFRVVAEL